MNYKEELEQFVCQYPQEVEDRRAMLALFEKEKDAVLRRSNALAHVTSSSMILNSERNKILMIFHNIYQSWAWTGGHADGESDMLEVAMREACEETGIVQVKPMKNTCVSIDILNVLGHFKHGNYVNAHVHLNYAYLLEADESEIVQVKEDENSGVMWIPIQQIEKYVNETQMIPIYKKVLQNYIDEE